MMCKAIDTMRNESKQEGKGLINKLNVILLEAGRFDDLKRATTDSEYQDQLIKELIDKDYEG